MIEKSNNKKNTGTDVVIEIKDNSGFSNIEKAPVAGWRSLINILFVTKHDDDGPYFKGELIHTQHYKCIGSCSKSCERRWAA